MKPKNLFTYTQIAYKKLKNNIFYDKTAAVTRDKIVCFEDKKIDEKLEQIANNLERLNDDAWEKYQSKILDSIKVLLLPKK